MDYNTTEFSAINNALNIQAEKAYLENPETVRQGLHCVSIETTQAEDIDLYGYITTNYKKFIQLSGTLDPESRDLLLSYFLLSKAQQQLTRIHRTDRQTTVSMYLHCSIRYILARMLFEEPPSVQLITAILAKYTVTSARVRDEKKRAQIIRAPQIIHDYLTLGDLKKVSKLHKLREPELRRLMKSKAILLKDKPGQQEQALAWWLLQLLQVKHFKKQILHYKDSTSLGDFHIKLTKSTKMFHSRAAVEHLRIS